MRYLGIDYGDVRIGVAVSDEEGKFAFPKLVIENQKKDARKKIESLVKESNISTIVIGLFIRSPGDIYSAITAQVSGRRKEVFFILCIQ